MAAIWSRPTSVTRLSLTRSFYSPSGSTAVYAHLPNVGAHIVNAHQRHSLLDQLSFLVRNEYQPTEVCAAPGHAKSSRQQKAEFLESIAEGRYAQLIGGVLGKRFQRRRHFVADVVSNRAIHPRCLGLTSFRLWVEGFINLFPALQQFPVAML